MSTRPRLYHRASIDWGAVACYLVVALAIVFLTAHVMLAIGDGRLP